MMVTEKDFHKSFSKRSLPVFQGVFFVLLWSWLMILSLGIRVDCSYEPFLFGKGRGQPSMIWGARGNREKNILEALPQGEHQKRLSGEKSFLIFLHPPLPSPIRSLIVNISWLRFLVLHNVEEWKRTWPLFLRLLQCIIVIAQLSRIYEVFRSQCTRKFWHQWWVAKTSLGSIWSWKLKMKKQTLYIFRLLVVSIGQWFFFELDVSKGHSPAC